MAGIGLYASYLAKATSAAPRCPTSLTPLHSLASAHPGKCETFYIKNTEQEHSFAEAVDRSKPQEARTVDQNVENAAH
jgi:hypothetical protein